MAAIDINSVYITVGDLASKNQSGGYLSPEEFSNFCALTQKELVNDVYQLLDANRSAITLLAPATKYIDSVTVANGYVVEPSDYKQVISFYGKYFENKEWNQKEAEYVSQSEIGDRLRNQIDVPSYDYPVVVQDMDGLKVYPKEISIGAMSYIYDFPDPVYSVTGDPPVYDPLTSVNFILDDVFFDLVVYKVCLLFGISIKDQNLQQASVRNVLKAM